MRLYIIQNLVPKAGQRFSAEALPEINKLLHIIDHVPITVQQDSIYLLHSKILLTYVLSMVHFYFSPSVL